MNDINERAIEAHLNRALDKLFELDAHILEADASERSMSHRLAVHLMPELPGYDIDCEYNRDGFDVKRLELYGRDNTDENMEAVTVFPDIVVHRRGTNDTNLLVIEMKKGSSIISSEYDMLKLRAFRRELNYRYAAHVTIGKNSLDTMVRELVWVDA